MSSVKLRPGLLILLVAVFFTSASQASTAVKVMTYNIFEGTEFVPILSVINNPNASISDFQTAVTSTIDEVQNSNPVLRAQLIANEISNVGPDLLGLQEVAVWTFNGQQIDLGQLILEDLGGQYTVVATAPEFQLAIPQFNVEFQDQELILARVDELTSGKLAIIDNQAGHYNAQVPLPAVSMLGLSASSLTRGWAYVDARLNGTPFRFVTTHLEDGTNKLSPLFALVQALQASELVHGPAVSAGPVIMAGDFNTVANNPASPTFLTYLLILANGFTDAWLRTHPFQRGLTCCQEDLTSATSELTQRLDLVLTRDHIAILGTQVVGNHLDTITNLGSSWPSDHAALKSTLWVGSVF
jgi:endonuclease/exonuclease/phosphatase family metal-dependent hydrolase